MKTIPYIYDRSARHRRAHYSMLGKRRAAFWRLQGFPNLIRARAKLAENRAKRKAEAAMAKLCQPWRESTRQL